MRLCASAPAYLAASGTRMPCLCVLVALAACVPPSTNLTDPLGPRHAGPLPGPPPANAGDEVRVVSFNLKEGEAIQEAADMLRDDDDLRDADVVLLQEMDAVGAEWIADALGMAWVYYPATLRGGRGFGNAVLSRWPIVDDQKVILPHVGRLRGTQRSATATTVMVREIPIRVYSVHLATIIDQSLEERRSQLRAVLDHAGDAPRVIIGGDLNAESIGEVAVDRGYAWPTRDGPRTSFVGRLDHVFFRGLAPAGAGAATELRDASDHVPVWAVGRMVGDTRSDGG